MKREAEYTPQEFDKITFDLLGSRRAGVVIEYKGVLIVRCIDKKSNEIHQISPARTIGPKLSNIEFVGKVRPHRNAYEMVCDYIYREDVEKNTTTYDWVRWMAQAPGVALCTEVGDGIVLCEVEKPSLTYEYVGEFHTKTVPDDDSTGDL